MLGQYFSTEAGGGIGWLVGPDVPITLEPSHSVVWQLDVPELISEREAERLPTQVHAYADLSTGLRVWETITIDEWAFDRAWRVLEHDLRVGKRQHLPPWPLHRSSMRGISRELPTSGLRPPPEVE